MSGGKFHVHGPHDHAVEHEAHAEHGAGHGASLGQQVAIFTAILATLGAIVSYLGGHTQNEALYYKNEAVLKKADASNQWSFFQAKGTKKNLAELAEQLTTDPEKKAKYAADMKRYQGEQDEIRKKAEAAEKLSDEANKTSETALNPHHKLSMSMTFIQIAISLASICVLTRRRWMLGLAGVAGAIGIGYWVMAYALTGLGH